MKKFLAVFVICCLLFTGCVSNKNKKLVQDTVKEYFTFLKNQDYDSANLMVTVGNEDITPDITKSAVNDLLFKDIQYEIWNIREQDGYLVAETVITQLSIKTAYISTVKEYAQYIENAENENKTFSETALEEKWNEIFYNNVSSLTEKATFKCDIYISLEDESVPKILMTAPFRNALFGGTLDAIESLNNKQEKNYE